MTIPAQIQPDVRPYWIIVSDEGAASFPYRHETYDAAYAEGLRLSKVKPGLKFNIFKFLGYAISEEPKTSFHTYSEPVRTTHQYWYRNPGNRYSSIPDDQIPF